MQATTENKYTIINRQTGIEEDVQSLVQNDVFAIATTATIGVRFEKGENDTFYNDSFQLKLNGELVAEPAVEEEVAEEAADTESETVTDVVTPADEATLSNEVVKEETPDENTASDVVTPADENAVATGAVKDETITE